MQIAQTDAPIIEVQHLYKDFAVNSNAIKSGKMRALSDITFNLHRGRALAVVGESGSGKSTIAKIIAEPAETTITERGATRLDDQTSEASMEQRKKEGYF